MRRIADAFRPVAFLTCVAPGFNVAVAAAAVGVSTLLARTDWSAGEATSRGAANVASSRSAIGTRTALSASHWRVFVAAESALAVRQAAGRVCAAHPARVADLRHAIGVEHAGLGDGFGASRKKKRGGGDEKSQCITHQNTPATPTDPPEPGRGVSTKKTIPVATARAPATEKETIIGRLNGC